MCVSARSMGSEELLIGAEKSTACNIIKLNIRSNGRTIYQRGIHLIIIISSFYYHQQYHYCRFFFPLLLLYSLKYSVFLAFAPAVADVCQH